MGRPHIARGSIKSVEVYELRLLGESNGHLKKRIFYTKISILIIYYTVPSKFPFLQVSVLTTMH